jgi:sugar (pentulose or hexulose) kinase
MNLWDIRKNSWDAMLLATAAGGAEYVDELARKLGGVEQTPGKKLGNINTWFVERFGFNKGSVPNICHSIIKRLRLKSYRMRSFPVYGG